ncbi:tumor necrosis factor receptor superfamily member 6B-like [Engraulis encrasicolus]|uniref:tumor necrosis factor receptor superfamily member 6B-like n=1 Tax=Engraulis encrasicolus TaxID=184585 RepID=UPI002FD3243C
MFMWYVSLSLAAVLLTGPSSCQSADPTYLWRDAQTGEDITCNKCPPGKFVGAHCTKDTATQCLECGQGHYTEFSNYLEECLMCDYSCTEVQEEKRACAPTHNRQCICMEGYYAMYDFCLKHTACPAGEGVKANGTREYNVECEPCKEGTFNNESSTTATCKPHLRCQNHQATIPGNSVHNTFCTPCKANSTEPHDKKVCAEEAMRLVLERVPAGKLGRLKKVLRSVTRTPAQSKTMQELMEVLVVKQDGSVDLQPLLKVLERARVYNCLDTIKDLLI